MAWSRRSACAMLLTGSLLPVIVRGYSGAGSGVASLRKKHGGLNALTAHAQPRPSPLRCIVTGGSSGIGEAVCRELGKRGAKVFVTGRKEENLQRVAAAVEEAGGHSAYGAGDVAVEADVKRLYSEAEAFFSKGITVNSFGADVWVCACSAQRSNP